jgi:PKD repeat protein
MAFLGISLLFLCMINPVSAVGIFRNSLGNWYLDYNNTGVIDKTLHFGVAGDIPVIGDWDGKGNDGAAVFRPSTGYWYFDYNLDGIVDKSFRYGGISDQVIAGDWDGNGIDGIAIFRNTTGYWYFDYNLDGIVDKSFRYGGISDRIIVGDWQGTGRDGIAIFRPSTGYWYFDYNLDGIVDKSFRYGGISDRIIVGDWQGTGRDGIAIFRPSTGYWYFDDNLDGIVDRSFRYGGAPDEIVKGDWQGTGRDGIAIFRPSTGYWYFDYNLDGTVDRSFRYGGSNDRIVVGKWNSVSAPVADFTADRRSGTAPLTVTFTDQSNGTAPLTYAWDFTNDGVTDSTVQNPSFTYPAAGTYTVTHAVTNTLGSDAEIKTSYINVSPAPVAPTAQFSGDVRSGYAPLTVHFTNQSNGTAPLTYAWDFTSDYEEDSNNANPTFTYTTPGTYTVTLTATNIAGSDSEVKNGYITVLEVPAPPEAGFTSNKRSGAAPLTVRFTDTSGGSSPMTYAWNFGDGVTSNSQNPTHSYSQTGTYTVTLRATNSFGTDVATRSGYITVTEGQPGGSHAGIALTFDDNYIVQWYAIRPMLQQYNAHATFFVSNFGSLDEDQIEMLRTLQADGHEIGFHGLYHTEARTYLQNHTVQQYLDYDIIPGLNQMRAAGFDPVDFAYPGGSDTPAATQALEGYFGHVRDTYYGWDETIYYSHDSNQAFIAGIGIDDRTYGNSINDIYNGISRTQEDNTVLITYGHEPVRNVTGDYQTSYDRLDKILKYASDNNVQFYTIRELT